MTDVDRVAVHLETTTTNARLRAVLCKYSLPVSGNKAALRLRVAGIKGPARHDRPLVAHCRNISFHNGEVDSPLVSSVYEREVEHKQLAGKDGLV